jgi:hypothetical protein
VGYSVADWVTRSLLLLLLQLVVWWQRPIWSPRPAAGAGYEDASAVQEPLNWRQQQQLVQVQQQQAAAEPAPGALVTILSIASPDQQCQVRQQLWQLGVGPNGVASRLPVE